MRPTAAVSLEFSALCGAVVTPFFGGRKETVDSLACAAQPWARPEANPDLSATQAPLRQPSHPGAASAHRGSASAL